MLNNVPISVAYSLRQVVLRHPNTIKCEIHRKVVLRVEEDPETGDPDVMGGLATMGGMGVLRSEDEADYEYQLGGDGRMLMIGVQQESPMVEADNGTVPQMIQEAQVECLAEPGTPGYFLVDTGDLVFAVLGFGVVIGYEVVGVTGNIQIPPYTRKLQLCPRDHLKNLEVIMPGAAP